MIQAVAAIQTVNTATNLLSSLTTSATERARQAALAGDPAGEAIVRAKLASYVAPALRAQLGSVLGAQQFLAARPTTAELVAARDTSSAMSLAYVPTYSGWLRQIYAAWTTAAGAGAAAAGAPSLNTAAVSSGAPGTSVPSAQSAALEASAAGVSASSSALGGSVSIGGMQIPTLALVAVAGAVVVLLARRKKG
jgi:hypothetical protein